jgi:flagellar biosynthetic protein FlhB
MSDESTERIHPPTPHRRQIARQQGLAAKSHDLPLAGVFLAGVLLLGGSELFAALADCVRQPLSGSTMLPTDASMAFEAGNGALLRLGRSLALVCGSLLGIAVIGHLLQTGFQPQPQRLAPDLSRLDPLATAARMFSGDAAARQVMLLLKLAVLAGVAVWAVWDQRDRILGLGNLAPAALANGLADLLSAICLKIGGALVIVAAADYGFQRWRYEQSLQMTPDEMREEMRSQNGDPGVQRRRRQVQRDLALPHVESAVVRAQLVLVQGASLAVALQYDGQVASAPIVVAKGRGDAAAKIRKTADRVKIHVVEAARLTQAITQQTPVGLPVAAEHYRAIANLWQPPDSKPHRASA